MKNLALFLLTISLVFVMVSAHAQSEAPKTGFAIKFSSSQVKLKAGEPQTITATILRSKRFRKSKIDLKVMPLPEGLQAEVTKNDVDSFTITLQADAALKLGDYTVTIMGKSPFLNKGALLSVKLVDKNTVIESAN